MEKKNRYSLLINMILGTASFKSLFLFIIFFINMIDSLEYFKDLLIFIDPLKGSI